MNQVIHRHLTMLVFFTAAAFLISGCALVQPRSELSVSTPIDWGLEESFASSITVLPFEAENEEWGAYAARLMQESLLENKAFETVILSDDADMATRYLLRGQITNLYYGGSHSPSSVSLNVRVIDTLDGHTRFFRRATLTEEKRGVHVTWLKRIYMPSAYPESLMTSLIDDLAGEIADRTCVLAPACP